MTRLTPLLLIRQFTLRDESVIVHSDLNLDGERKKRYYCAALKTTTSYYVDFYSEYENTDKFRIDVTLANRAQSLSWFDCSSTIYIFYLFLSIH